MELLEAPRVVERAEQHCLGIRTITPFRGMLSKRNELLDELFGRLREAGVDDSGLFFLRLHVIDMAGPMDIEVGMMTPGPLPGDDRVRPSTLPAGRYATLTYRNHSLRANRALLDWVAAEGLVLDRREVPEGDLFTCRYEAFRTDPRSEPRKTKWAVELDLRLADA